MDTKFSVALDIIKSVKDLEGRFQINTHQCQRLASLYGKAGQFLQHLQKVNQDFNGSLSLPSLDVTESVLRSGHLLVANCTKEDWFESLVTAGVNQDSFKAIHVELEACIRMIYERVETGLAGSTQVPRPLIMQLAAVLPLLYLDESDRASLFERDAEMDKKDILTRIQVERTTVFRSKYLTDAQITQEIRSLEMAMEKLSETNARTIDVQQPATTEDLPSNLRIKSSEINMLRQIGTGGSGAVYECRWMHIKYAVKILRTNDVVGLRKEVENLIPLRHPHIVLMVGFSVEESSSRPMIVMELLDQDLHSLLSERGGNPFPISTAVDFIYQIATGMAYLHRLGILHGDLKALNVLIRHHQGEYELKISDFGVSEHAIIPKMITEPGIDDYKFVDNNSFNTVNVGTTRWRAPEVFDVTNGDARKYSLKADVYSFSMTCVEILTGDVPYGGIATRDIKKHVQAGIRPELPSTVPEDLRNLMARCWHPEPTSRPDFPQICTEMQRLKEFLLPQVLPQDVPQDDTPTRCCNIL